MSIRYIYNAALGITAGFLVVATQAFATAPARWIVFGIAAGVLAGSFGVIVVRDAGLAQRVLGAAAVALGAWTVIATLVFSAGTAVTLGFASALAFAGLALIGLTVHEVKTERVVHELEIREAPAPAAHAGDTEHWREPIAA